MAQTWVYPSLDAAQEENLLKASIAHAPRHSWNHVSLADLYYNQLKIKEANQCIVRALDAIEMVGLTFPSKDISNIQDFLDVYLRGTCVTKSINHIIIKRLQV